MESITLPKKEYLNLQKEIQFLRDSEFLKRVSELIDMLLEEKYGLFMSNYTDDLTEYSIDREQDWKVDKSGWDNV